MERRTTVSVQISLTATAVNDSFTAKEMRMSSQKVSGEQQENLGCKLARLQD